MILGIGSDLCDIRRIERALARFGDRFRNRIFSPEEQAKAARRAYPAATYAKRFAAKEACAKALGAGFRAGVFWRDITVFSRPGGQPGLRLAGGALKRLEAMTPKGMRAELHLTLTDEPPLAQAFVLIAARPLRGGGA